MNFFFAGLRVICKHFRNHPHIYVCKEQDNLQALVREAATKCEKHLPSVVGNCWGGGGGGYQIYIIEKGKSNIHLGQCHPFN